MKKLIALTLAAFMFVTGMVMADEANSAKDNDVLTGMITEMTEDGFALLTDNGVCFVTMSEETVLDAEGGLAVGNAVTVSFSGPTDRKTVNADAVTCYSVQGVVTEIGEGDEPYFLLMPEAEEGAAPIRVNCTAQQLLFAGPDLPVTVYYNGMMTRSIPAQITALFIEGTVLTGDVTAVEEDGSFWMTAEDGEEVIVHIAEDAAVLAEIGEGAGVIVYCAPMMTLSLPAQYQAQIVLTK